MGAFSAGYNSAGNAVNCNIPVLKGTEIAIAWDGITVNKKVFIKTAQEIIEPTNTDIDYVVSTQLPTAENNRTWYRLYKSGWVEQGGFVSAISSSRNVTITLPIEMADNTYNCQKTNLGGADKGEGFGWSWHAFQSSTESNTSTQIVVSVAASSFVNGVNWQVSGMSKQ